MGSVFRIAVPRDIVSIARLLRTFYRRDGVVYGIDYDHDSCVDLVAGVIASGVCLVGPTSCAAAAIHPFMFNKHVPVASVLFWYFERPRELKIFEALCLECKARGAKMISPAATATSPSISRLYKRMGLRFIERNFIGEISCKADPVE